MEINRVNRIVSSPDHGRAVACVNDHRLVDDQAFAESLLNAVSKRPERMLSSLVQLHVVVGFIRHSSLFRKLSPGRSGAPGAMVLFRQARDLPWEFAFIRDLAVEFHGGRAPTRDRDFDPKLKRRSAAASG
jgi:hypothetical protein